MFNQTFQKYKITNSVNSPTPLSSIKNINSIPTELLKLFIIHQSDIANHSNYVALNESNEKYDVRQILKSKKIDKTFHELLFKHIDNSNFSEIEIYKKADITRKLFSKIRTDSNYHPSFGTITALALALELSAKEYEIFLKSASYSLPLNSYINITLKYCFDNKIYNLNKVNNLLYSIANKTVRDL